ncbi:MAG: ATP phosphoribosyltransferase regulatory subunit [Pseudomonadota bacterium]
MKNHRDTHWQLPDGMDEMLPERALALEHLRRRIYDLHLSWGYAPVHPPFVEYLESLLSSTGQDFDRQTFKVADPVSGRMMGVRADMTPQVARIDAHTLGGEGIKRLFYMGTVIRAYADGVNGQRSPLQMGAELFGHSGIESDVEVIRLMLETLACVGVTDVHLDLGHADIFRSIGEALQLTDADQRVVFELLQTKSEHELARVTASLGISQSDQNTLCALCSLNGGASVLTRADELLAGYGDNMCNALQTLRVIGRQLTDLSAEVTVHYDLAEVRGYQYHNGVVFAAYVPQRGGEIARGGRYDGIGEIFGSLRAATGYSTDLKTLMSVIRSNSEQTSGAISAPFRGSNDESSLALAAQVRQLRAAGETVITRLPQGAGDKTTDRPADVGCDRQLIEKDGRWLLEKIK